MYIKALVTSVRDLVLSPRDLPAPRHPTPPTARSTSDTVSRTPSTASRVSSALIASNTLPLLNDAATLRTILALDIACHGYCAAP